MRSPAQALRAVRAAAKAGAWRADPHLLKRLAQRGIGLVDVLAALQAARRIQPHDMLPLNPGGESWRVYGPDTDGRTLGMGVELVTDDDGDLMIIITVFVEDAGR